MIKILAILLVVVFINAIMVIAIVNIAKRTDDNLKKYFLEKTGNLFSDTIVQEVVKEVPVPEGPEVIIHEKTPEPYAYPEQKVVNYKDSDFKEKYKDLKLGMSFDKYDTVYDVIQQEEEEYVDDEITQAIFTINKEFDFETIFELSTVSSEEQLKILRESFNVGQNKVLALYLESLENQQFSSITFFNYIKQQAQLNDPNFYVRTAWEDDSFNDIGQNVKTVLDNEIVDGIKIVHKSKLYDYSI